MKIGIDMGGTNIRVGLVDGDDIVKKVEKATLAHRSEKEILDDLIAAIKEAITPEVKSIGVGVPSVVDIKAGIVYNVANIDSWKEVHLKEILETEFKIPVAINNDANCFALGEQKHGEAKGSCNMVGVTIGTGVGAGLILNGQLYSGTNTGAGEIGHFPYLDKNAEYYCSGQFFSCEHNVKGHEVARKAAEGDAEALKLFNDFGKHIGNLMKTVLFAYDPEVIVLGGSVSKAYQFFSEEMYNVINTFPYENTVKNLKIFVSKREDIGILGAAELI
ncbi:ROK family protein [Dysgonomonas sp. Marseille-P4361]|uniref:ROK family protein n=1 Tax=Dysgonomonas sp. Marseille-P4361 TaxID=2161820 RepID=UPI000D54EB5D|nr:ROK family protein [Dysgonomonas sp. Marseille-P4361]